MDLQLHIPNEEVLQDIVDTEDEIIKMEREIAERKRFILKLRALLAARENRENREI